MKHLIIVLAAFATLAAHAQIGAENIIKQRAHDVANQNNNRDVDNPNGTPATTKPATPAAPPPTAAPQLNAAQQAYARFQTDLFAVKTNATPENSKLLASDMTDVARGNKPKASTTSKLADDLTAAMAESKLSVTKKGRVAQEVAILLNNANAAPEQKQALIKDVQATLTAGGVSNEHTSAVAVDLQKAVDEIAKPPAA
jgi:hypothetical protein